MHDLSQTHIHIRAASIRVSYAGDALRRGLNLPDAVEYADARMRLNKAIKDHGLSIEKAMAIAKDQIGWSAVCDGTYSAHVLDCITWGIVSYAPGADPKRRRYEPEDIRQWAGRG